MVDGYIDYTISLFSANGIANTEIYIENIYKQIKPSVFVLG